MERITFYVGILPEDKQELLSFVSDLNEDSDHKFYASIEGTFDDPHGYFEYVIKGTWDCYKCFFNRSFVKSLNHYEE
jgi:hypothetical protein